MARDEKLIIKILHFLKDKNSVDSYRLDIDEYDLNSIVEQLDICLEEGLISVTNKLLGADDETVGMEGIKLTSLGIEKLEDNP